MGDRTTHDRHRPRRPTPPTGARSNTHLVDAWGGADGTLGGDPEESGGTWL